MAHKSAWGRRLPVLILSDARNPQSALAVVALTATALVPWGCGEAREAAYASTCPGAPGAEIWSGIDSTLAPLADGDRIYVRCGTQGRRHVRLRLRANGTTPTFKLNATLTLDLGDALIARNAPAHALPFYAVPGACDSPDILLITDRPSAALANQPATLDVTITGTDARALTTHLGVIMDVDHMSCTP